MNFSPANLRARFAELQGLIDAKHAISDPLRAERDAFVNDARAREAAMNANIAAAEEGLFDLKQELALICNALDGQTGEPKPAPEEVPAEGEAVAETVVDPQAAPQAEPQVV